jgi:predicted transcriptional regulator
LECLSALWLLGEANVQGVRDHLAPKKPLAYTTVMTMLDRLARKQAVTRRKEGRSYVYKAVISRDEVRRLAVRELLDSLFDGELAGLLTYLGTAPVPVSGPNGAITADEREEAQTLDAALL